MMESIDKNIQNIGNGKNGETVERFTKRRRFGVRCLRLLVASVLLATFFAILASCAEDEPTSQDHEFYLVYVDQYDNPVFLEQSLQWEFLMQTEPITTYSDGSWEVSEIRNDAIKFAIFVPAYESIGAVVVPNVPYGRYYVYNNNRNYLTNREVGNFYVRAGDEFTVITSINPFVGSSSNKPVETLFRLKGASRD